MKLLGRYKNGNYNVSIFDDGTKIRTTEEDNFVPSFAENMDIKICNKCNMNCAFCHEGSTCDGKLGDIMNEKFIETLHPYQEVALGGGNVLEHPDLVPFLEKLKGLKVISNITINQIHFMQNYTFIKRLAEQKLVYGIGVSLVEPTDDFIKLVKNIPNVVIHTINGVLKEDDILKLKDKDLKILILGYKHLRKGNDYYAANNKLIENNQKYVYDNLAEILKQFKVVSFDNLAIEQLNVKRLLTDEEWEEFYMGDDSQYTYYIDMVERKFAKSSIAPFDERYDLLDNVDDMFEKIRLWRK